MSYSAMTSAQVTMARRNHTHTIRAATNWMISHFCDHLTGKVATCRDDSMNPRQFLKTTNTDFTIVSNFRCIICFLRVWFKPCSDIWWLAHTHWSVSITRLAAEGGTRPILSQDDVLSRRSNLICAINTFAEECGFRSFQSVTDATAWITSLCRQHELKTRYKIQCRLTWDYCLPISTICRIYARYVSKYQQ